ncbi:MAG: hypothetical protein WC509_00520 [Candidatus Izemoplasmatales bacterium]
MKRQELKRMIRRAALAEMPDVRGKIDLERVPVAPAPEPAPRRLPRFNYAFALKAAMVLLLAALTGIFIYDRLKTDDPVVLALETEAEIYGFQMVSATALLSQFADADIAFEPIDFGDGPMTTQPHGGQTTGPGGNDPTTTIPIASDPIVTLKMQKLNEFLNTMEVMLAEKDVTTYEIVEIDVLPYRWQLTFTTVDLLGNALSYEILYNQSADPGDVNRSLIDGVMTMGGDEYALSGAVTAEGETVRTRFTAVRGDDSITIVDQTDADGQKYLYEVTRDGALYESVQMRLSREDDNLVAAIASETADDSYEFSFRRGEDGAGFMIRYRVEIDGQTEIGRLGVAVAYDEEQGVYRYQYEIDAETGNHAGHSSHSGERTDKTRGGAAGHGMDTSFVI